MGSKPFNTRPSRFKDLPQNQEPQTTAYSNSINTNNLKRLNTARGGEPQAGNPLPPTPGSLCDPPPPRAGAPLRRVRGSLCTAGARGRPPPVGGQSRGGGGGLIPMSGTALFPRPRRCYSWMRVTHIGGPRAGAAIPGMHYYLGRRVLGRAEEQMATAFNARRPPARGQREHLQPVPFARGGLSP